MKWILFLTFILSCASSKERLVQEKNEKMPIYERPLEVEVFNGKMKFIEFPLPGGKSEDYITCKEQESKNPLIKKFPLSVTKGMAYLYYAESYHSQAKIHFCYVGDAHVLTVKVKAFPYKEEKLNVAKGKVVLSEQDQARVAKEWQMTQKLYKNSEKESLITDSFKVPLKSFITSHYGKRRIFNNLKRTQHLGNDFRAKVGVPIPVSNRGKVVYAGNLFYTGNVVIVDHGMGIFTLYAHLSKIDVKEGDMIHQNQIVGLSGKTGRVSGPHLHWGVKAHGFNIDGFSLVEESKRQFVNHGKVN